MATELLSRAVYLSTWLYLTDLTYVATERAHRFRVRGLDPMFVCHFLYSLSHSISEEPEHH